MQNDAVRRYVGKPKRRFEGNPFHSIAIIDNGKFFGIVYIITVHDLYVKHHGINGIVKFVQYFAGLHGKTEYVSNRPVGEIELVLRRVFRYEHGIAVLIFVYILFSFFRLLGKRDKHVVLPNEYGRVSHEVVQGHDVHFLFVESGSYGQELERVIVAYDIIFLTFVLEEFALEVGIGSIVRRGLHLRVILGHETGHIKRANRRLLRCGRIFGILGLFGRRYGCFLAYGDRELKLLFAVFRSIHHANGFLAFRFRKFRKIVRNLLVAQINFYFGKRNVFQFVVVVKRKNCNIGKIDRIADLVFHRN